MKTSQGRTVRENVNEWLNLIVSFSSTFISIFSLVQVSPHGDVFFQEVEKNVFNLTFHSTSSIQPEKSIAFIKNCFYFKIWLAFPLSVNDIIPIFH